jgi:hypothetical protein
MMIIFPTFRLNKYALTLLDVHIYIYIYIYNKMHNILASMILILLSLKLKDLLSLIAYTLILVDIF